MKKRSKEAPCLLCDNNLADKKNSHIIPKFIGKEILKNEGPNKAYVLDTSKPHHRPRIEQDSPKEDYILCSECEKYFEILETYNAKYLFKLIDSDKSIDYFDRKISEGHVEYYVCNDLDLKLFRLFVISLFWRCHATSVEPFRDFTLNGNNHIKKLLTHYKTISIVDFLDKGLIQDLTDFPVVVLKADKGIDSTGNFLFANDEHHPIYQLQINNFILIVSLDKNIDLSRFDFLENIGLEKIKIGILPTSSWLKLRDNLFNQAAIKANDNGLKN